MLAISLALLSCLCWGTSSFLAGTKSKIIPVLTLLLFSSIAGVVMFSFILAVRAEPMPKDPNLLFAVLGGVGGLLGLFCLYRGLSQGAISIVVPVSGLCVLLPVIAGLAQGEVLHPLQGFGVIIAVAGGMLVSWERPSQGQPNQFAKGFFPALGAALGFGIFYVMMDLAGPLDPLWAATVSRTSLLLLLLPAIFYKRPPLKIKATHIPAVSAIGMLEALAAFLYTTATTKGLLSLVSVVSSLYPCVAILLAALVLKERLRRYQFIAVLLIVLGISLISAF